MDGPFVETKDFDEATALAFECDIGVTVRLL